MSEKEKMLSGEYYNPADAELFYERMNAKCLCQKYNRYNPLHLEARVNTIKKLFGKCGINPYIEPNFYCDYGYNIEIGNHFYANHNLVILDCSKVKIGDNVLLGPNCGIYTAAHPLNSNERNTGLELAKPVTIGNNVWIGGNTCIMPGINIGNNTVIGAGSVVTKDIPSNVVAVGNPCRVIKQI